jgi:hypothetical protein
MKGHSQKEIESVYFLIHYDYLLIPYLIRGLSNNLFLFLFIFYLYLYLKPYLGLSDNILYMKIFHLFNDISKI